MLRAFSSAPTAAAVRVRYAPSPTGFLHLGGLRTALFNYLLARSTGGAFLLRIEDTDKTRQVPGSIAGLVSALRWCGLDFDEGPVPLQPTTQDPPPRDEAALFGSRGPHGPYIQSQRLPLYRAAADELLASGHAYRCFCSSERLTALRAAQTAKGSPTMYDRACAHIPAGEAERRAGSGEPHVVRMRVPAGASTLQDAVLGPVSFAHGVVDDQVLVKSDGFPTYHLASVVDDHAMAISHVIRGQEWLSSTPKHLLLYAAFGWAPPSFAHLPLLLDTNRAKLSKRHGDAAVEDFRAAGYSPEGLLNFVALLGWTPPPAAGAPAPVTKKKSGSGGSSPSGTSEVMTLQQMVESFRLSDINKANAVADRARLDFFNGEHLRRVFASAAVPPTSASAASPASAAPTQAAAPSEQPFIPAELRVIDTPVLAELRGNALADFDAHLLLLLQRDSPASPSSAAAAPPASRGAVEYVNAALTLQHERVRVLRDFAPLLMPFLSTEEEFAEWVNVQAGGAPGEKLVKSLEQLLSPEQKALLADASEQTAIRSDVIRRAVASLLSGAPPLAPALRSLADRWDGMADVEFCGGAAALDAAKAAAAAAGLPPPKLLLALRFCLTGLDAGGALTPTMGLLGRRRCVQRVRAVAAGLR